MSFPKFDKWGERVRVFLKIFVASIYHPDDIKESGEFNETLSLLMDLITKNVEFIGGHDVNANLGVRKQMYKNVIGIYVLDNRNMKGRNLLGVLWENNLRVVNSFRKSAYTPPTDQNSKASHLTCLMQSYFQPLSLNVSVTVV